jgi:hypothetical protein
MSNLLSLSELDLEVIHAGLWGLIQDRYEASVEAWQVVADTCPINEFFVQNSVHIPSLDF